MHRLLRNFITTMRTHPQDMRRLLLRSPLTIRGLSYRLEGEGQRKNCFDESKAESNPLRRYFKERQTGRGIWKWDHYFDIYHRYFQKFVGRNVKIMEIGIYSGGSLELWRNYFGEQVLIYGVDIEKECIAYNNEFTKILVGDQGDRSFLRSIVSATQSIDILVDDGSHIPEHQISTFEEIFPYIRPGGVFLCEDIHGIHNDFLDYVHGLNKGMCAMSNSNEKSVIPTTSLQRWIKSIHVYPYVVVIEKAETPTETLLSCKRGTQWQPFSAKKKGKDEKH